MNSKDLYELIVEIFPRDELSVAMFVNPMYVHDDRFNIQFTTSGGSLVSKFKRGRPRVVADPLAGPFFQLPVSRIMLNEYPRATGGKGAMLRTEVIYANSERLVSMPIVISRTVGLVSKELMGLSGISNYSLKKQDQKLDATKTFYEIAQT